MNIPVESRMRELSDRGFGNPAQPDPIRNHKSDLKNIEEMMDQQTKQTGVHPGDR